MNNLKKQTKYGSGYMGILSSIFNYLLHYLFNVTGDWGIAIITLTLLVRFLLLPISIK